MCVWGGGGGGWVVKRKGWKNNLGSHCGGFLVGFNLIGHEEPSEIFEWDRGRAGQVYVQTSQEDRSLWSFDQFRKVVWRRCHCLTDHPSDTPLPSPKMSRGVICVPWVSITMLFFSHLEVDRSSAHQGAPHHPGLAAHCVKSVLCLPFKALLLISLLDCLLLSQTNSSPIWWLELSMPSTQTTGPKGITTMGQAPQSANIISSNTSACGVFLVPTNGCCYSHGQHFSVFA